MCKEKIKASKKKWRENNPDKVKIHNETYRHQSNEGRWQELLPIYKQKKLYQEKF